MMKCNPDDYRDEIAEFGLTKEQEDELLLTLWEMMRMCVEIGYGVDVIHNMFNGLIEISDQNSSELPE